MTKIIITLPDGRTVRINKTDTRIVYNIVAKALYSDITRISEQEHLAAADAEGWTELAATGEVYETSTIPGLRIEITEEN